MSGGNMTLEPGEYHQVNIDRDIGVFIEVDQSTMVAQYMKGFATTTPTLGDPSMLIVPPVSAYANDVTFSVFRYSALHKYYINVATKCENVAGLLFDDAISMASWDNVTTDSMCCVRGEVSTGFHSVSQANPAATFSVSVYALGTPAGPSIPSSYLHLASGMYAAQH